MRQGFQQRLSFYTVTSARYPRRVTLLAWK
jgi:hypothetical protein